MNKKKRTIKAIIISIIIVTIAVYALIIGVVIRGKEKAKPVVDILVEGEWYQQVEGSWRIHSDVQMKFNADDETSSFG